MAEAERKKKGKSEPSKTGALAELTAIGLVLDVALTRSPEAPNKASQTQKDAIGRKDKLP